MKQGYLAQESQRINEVNRRLMLKVFIIFVCAISIIYFLGKDSLDFTHISYGSPIFILAVCSAIILVCLPIRLFLSTRTAVNGSNLILPYQENTKEEVGKIIDEEALEGNILVEKFIYEFSGNRKKSGEKIILTPSYLLLSGYKRTSKVTAIPRDKIYWICPQVGKKGGPFIINLLIFTEKKLFTLTGVDIEYVESIANQLYQYIPNVFSDYDPFIASYNLEKIFADSPEEFLKIYEEEKNKKSM